MTTWAVFRDAVVAAVTGAMPVTVSTPANLDGPTVTWTDAARPFAKHRLLLGVVSTVFNHDRDSSLSTGGAQELSTMATVTVQVTAESSYDRSSAPGDALWLLEQVRLGLRRVSVREALADLQIAVVGFPLATVSRSYPADGRIISAHSFDVALRVVFDLDSGEDAGLIESVEALGDAPGELDGVAIEVDAPAEPVEPTALIGARLDVADAVDGSSVPDGLNVNPAVQATAGRRPAVGTSESGAAMLTFDGSDALAWPLTAENATNTAWGLALWLRPTSSIADGVVYSVSELSADTWRVYAVRKNQGEFSVAINSPSVVGSGRVGQTVEQDVVTDEWHFVTIEYDAVGATEADKLTITVDGTVQTLSFGNLGGGAAIGALPTATGDAVIGDITAGSATVPFTGNMGAHIWVLNAKDPDATEGLLTPAQRTALMSVDAPL